MNKENRPILMAFANQKGGVGKSTLTIAFASYLSYNLNKKVLILDCDYPQLSIYDLRQREMNFLGKEKSKENESQLNYWNTVFNHAQKLYDIESIAFDSKISIFEAISAHISVNPINTYDCVLFDFAGTINNVDLDKVIRSLDYIFTPILPGRSDFSSSLTFLLGARALSSTLPACQLLPNNIYPFWSLVDMRVSPKLLELMEESLKDKGFKFFETRLPRQEAFNKEFLDNAGNGVFVKSTVLPPSEAILKTTRLNQLFVEIIKIITK